MYIVLYVYIMANQVRESKYKIRILYMYIYYLITKSSPQFPINMCDYTFTLKERAQICMYFSFLSYAE